MNLRATPAQKTLSPGQDSTGDTRLRGRWLVLAWLVWVALVILYMSNFIASLPVYFALLQKACRATSCAFGQLNPDTLQRLSALGISTNLYSLFFIMLNIIVILACTMIAILLLTHKPDDWMVLLVAFWLGAVLGTDNITADWTTLHQALGQVLSPVLFNFTILLDTVSTFLVFALLPTGHFIPRWIRWFVVTGSVLTIILMVIPLSTSTWLILINALILGVMCILVIAQVYRYRYVSSSVQRQQTKWVVFGLTVSLLFAIGLFVPELIIPGLSEPGSFYQAIISASWYVFSLLFALSFGIALLRYRLYDIDVIINRTLVYGTLTVSLALVYIGLVIGLQALVHLLTGQVSQSPVVIVASTLAIAALFQPLRRRIQATIDRRFYRRKYDAARTLEAFSATLRNEVDLMSLREHLLNVVQETMQPVHVSLWLRKSHHERKTNTQV